MIGSRAEYARHRGVSRTLITRWIKIGLCPALPDGRVDFDAADRALADNLDPTRGGKGGWSERLTLKAAAGAAAAEKIGEASRHAAADVRTSPARQAKVTRAARLIDVAASDAALEEQPNAADDFKPRTPIEKIVYAHEIHFAHQQNHIQALAATELKVAAGDDVALRTALGRMFGRLRHLLDQERRRLIAELEQCFAEDRP